MISVIVPIYNVEQYVEKCVESIMNQTYKDLEIILIDDGSTDGSGNICDEYAIKDSRIRVVHKENGGLSDARNAGIELAKGEFLSFVDGDDYIHPQMLEILYRNLMEQGCDISMCKFCHITEDEIIDTVLISDLVRKEECSLKALVTNSSEIASACNKLYKRTLFDDIRYPKGKLHEDEYVIHELLGKSEGIVISDAQLYFYVKREGSIMNVIRVTRIEHFMEAMMTRLQFLQEKNMLELQRFTIKMMIGHLEYLSRMAYEGKFQDKKKAVCAIVQGINELKKSYGYVMNKKERRKLWVFAHFPKIWTIYKKM